MIEMKIGYIEFNRTRVLLLLALLFLAISIASKSPPKESESEHNLNENDITIIDFEEGAAVYITWNATGGTGDESSFIIHRYYVEEFTSSDPDG